jgi:hypothetical protein
VSVDFDPVRIGGRRRMQPVVAGVAIVLIGLIVAVLKPWETSTGGVAEASPAASESQATGQASGAPTGGSTRRTTAPADTEDGIPAMRWSDLAGIVGSHPTAGVLAVTGHVSRFTGAGADVGLGASWVPGDAAPEGVGPNPGVRSGEAEVLGIGLTFPAGNAPLDVRISLERAGGELEWIDAASVARPAPDDPIVLERSLSGSTIQPFEAGHYRIDLLRVGSIEMVYVGIADSTGTLPAPIDWPLTESRLVPAGESDPSGVRFGLFATVDGFATALPVAQRRSFDEVEAWNASRIAPTAGKAASIVHAFLPTATGLGVMLTEHASIDRAVLVRLAPSQLYPIPAAPIPSVGGISDSQGRTPYIVFEGPDGRAFEPGIYALSVDWTDTTGIHAGTWHVEVQPGPAHG